MIDPDGLDRPGISGEILHVAPGHPIRLRFPEFVFGAQLDQVAGVQVGQRRNQYRSNGGEHNRGCADGNGNREQRDRGRGWSAAEETESVEKFPGIHEPPRIQPGIYFASALAADNAAS